jgi:hypothetical protein
MLYDRYDREPNSFYTVLVVAVAVVLVELLYFEREYLERRVGRFGTVLTSVSGLED